MCQVSPPEAKDDRSRLLRLAGSEEHHPDFLQRVAKAREALRGGRGVRLEDLPP